MPGIVHIIDDDDATRDSLRFLLAAEGIPVKDHASATVFLAGLDGFDVGCVVTDLQMPEMNGIELLKRLAAERADLPVIVVTGHGDIAHAVEAMKLGAADFIEKPYRDSEILDAIRVALERHDNDAAASAERTASRERIERLSAREQQVLSRLVAGKQNKEIAADLDISPRTVEVYRANVMAKMQANSLSHLVRMTLAAGRD